MKEFDNGQYQLDDDGYKLENALFDRSISANCFPDFTDTVQLMPLNFELGCLQIYSVNSQLTKSKIAC
jgi:hypothetical protein